MHDMLALIWILVCCFCIVEELDHAVYVGEKRMNQLLLIIGGIACSIVAAAFHLVLKLI